jgi:hypothetical protein
LVLSRSDGEGFELQKSNLEINDGKIKNETRDRGSCVALKIKSKQITQVYCPQVVFCFLEVENTGSPV